MSDLLPDTLLCEGCGNLLPLGEAEIGGRVTCPRCAAVRVLWAEPARDREGRPRKPRDLRWDEEEHGDVALCTYRSTRRRSMGFILVFAFLLFLVLVASSVGELFEGPMAGGALLGLAVSAMLATIFYALLATAWNRLTIRLDADSVTMTEEPLPVPGAREAIGGVRRFHPSVECGKDSEGDFQTRHFVRIEGAGGPEKRFAVESRDHALYVAHRLGEQLARLRARRQGGGPFRISAAPAPQEDQEVEAPEPEGAAPGAARRGR